MEEVKRVYVKVTSRYLVCLTKKSICQTSVTMFDCLYGHKNIPNVHATLGQQSYGSFLHVD